jgi:hypothetical protein
MRVGECYDVFRRSRYLGLFYYYPILAANEKPVKEFVNCLPLWKKVNRNRRITLA